MAPELNAYKLTIPKIEKLRQRWGMSKEDWQRAAIGFAEMHRDQAPPEIQARLAVDRLSLLPTETILICEIFLLVLVAAEERAKSIGAEIDPAACWRTALTIVGGRHER